jgi:hypothetical protein
MAQAVTGLEGVGQVDGDVVFFAQCDGDSPLGMNRTALERMAFRQHEDAAASAEFDGRAKTGNAAPYDKEVG